MERIWQNLWKRKKKKFAEPEAETKAEENKENDVIVASQGGEEVERVTIKSSGISGDQNLRH